MSYNEFIEWVKSIKDYAPLLSATIALMALTFSVFSFVVSNLISKSRAKKEKKAAELRYIEQKEQYEERMRVEYERYLEKQQYLEEKERKNEEPYLVYKSSKISKIEPTATMSRIIIDTRFLNKGRGAAYSIVPQLEFKAKAMDGTDYVIKRHGSVQDPIALQGEYFDMQIEYENIKEISLMTTIVIHHEDASGRKYEQQFKLHLDEEGEGIITNYAKPTVLG